jgi:hypothetical protein
MNWGLKTVNIKALTREVSSFFVHARIIDLLVLFLFGLGTTRHSLRPDPDAALPADGIPNSGRNLFAFIIPKTYIIRMHQSVDNPWRRNAR